MVCREVAECEVFTNNLLSKTSNSGLKTANTCGCITYGWLCTRAAGVNLVKGCNAVTIRAMVHSEHRLLYTAPWDTPAHTPRRVVCGCDWKDVGKVHAWRCENTAVISYLGNLRWYACKGDQWPTRSPEFRPVLGNPHPLPSSRERFYWTNDTLQIRRRARLLSKRKLLVTQRTAIPHVT
jgi:hypothetical protein